MDLPQENSKNIPYSKCRSKNFLPKSFLFLVIAVFSTLAQAAPITSADPDSLRSLAKLSAVTIDYYKANELLLQALEANNDQDLEQKAMILADLAYINLKTDQYNKAQKLCIESYRLQRQTLTTDHPHIAYILRTLSLVQMKNAQYNTAMSTLNVATGIMLRSHSPEDIALMPFNVDRATILKDSGRSAQAISVYQNALASALENYGSDHPYTAVIMTKLADLYAREKLWYDSKDLIQKAMDIKTRSFGKDSFEHVEPMLVQAITLAGMNQYDDALNILTYALDIINSNHMNNTEIAASVLVATGHVQTLKGDLYEAEVNLKKAIELSQQIFGEHHDHTAVAICELAELRYSQGRLVEAMDLCEKSLAILDNLFKDHHPAKVEVLATMYKLCSENSQTVAVKPVQIKKL